MSDDFDFQRQDYIPVFKKRAEAILRIREHPELLPALKEYYKENIAQFIMDWGMTTDPKMVERGLPSTIPFILFPKQIEFVNEVVSHWKNQRPLLVEKTRQIGMSVLSMAVACSLCLFHDGMAIGVGSRKESYVDGLGDPKSLFYKARFFMENLPVEFRGGWVREKHAPYMKMLFPETGASVIGEAGDGIGRGATTSLYFIDESSFIPRSHLIDASLSATTNCRIDISTPNGMQNSFAEKRFSGKIDVFTFDWRSDPRKSDAWYKKQCDELDPVTVAQEIDIDYSASTEGVCIPATWVRAAIDAHIKLGIEPTGQRLGALDVADEGTDNCAFAGRHGILIDFIDEWSGKNSTLFKTAEKAFDICDRNDYESFKYDGDGLGASVRGDAVEINKRRTRQIVPEIFRGSGEIIEPEKEDVKGRKNKDYFVNCKSQSWWALRLRFERTYNWVVEGKPCDPDSIISIDSRLKNRNKLVSELSQPTYSANGVGKILIDKKPDGTKSPNLADAVMMVFSGGQKSHFKINHGMIDRFRSLSRRY